MLKFVLTIFITIVYLKLYSFQYVFPIAHYVVPTGQTTQVIYGPTSKKRQEQTNYNPINNYNYGANGYGVYNDGQYYSPTGEREEINHNTGNNNNNNNAANGFGEQNNYETYNQNQNTGWPGQNAGQSAQNSNENVNVNPINHNQEENIRRPDNFGQIQPNVNENQNFGTNHTQSTGSESNPNDDNYIYGFLGKDDTANQSQVAVVQLRYDHQYYPNPYTAQNYGQSHTTPTYTNRQGKNIVVTNNPYCTRIASKLIQDGGNVREVFIATSLCEGLVHPMDSGLGGGFHAVYYNFEHNQRKAIFIDAREKSPGSNKFTRSQTRIGGNSIAIPSVLAGYEKIYKIDQHKNRLTWAQIIQPVLNLCKNGYIMSQSSKKMLQLVLGSYNRTHSPPDLLRIPPLCATYSQMIKDGPSSSMYRANGHLHRLLHQDLRSVKSTITAKDIQNYRAQASEAATAYFDEYTLYTTKSPGSGQAMLYALKIIERLRQIIPPTATNDEKIVYLLKILKYAYTLQPHLREISEDKINTIVNEASQSIADGVVKAGFKLQSTIPTKFGDVILPKLQSPAQRGTTNIVIKIGKSAITASSSINNLYGSGIFSETMGFFYNNHLKDFSNPNWRLRNKPLKNVAGPNKVPSSAIAPLIMVDRTGEPVFQIGSAGGSHILSAMINTCFNYFILNRSLKDSVAGCRIMPKFNYLRNKVSYLYECGIHDQTLRRLRKIGVDIKLSETAGYAAVTTFSKLRGGYPEAVFDNRRGGESFIQ